MEKETLFLNCTAHELTPEQREKALELSKNLQDLKQLNRELWEELVNCPSEPIALKTLCDKYFQFLKEFLETRKNEKIYFHFPIGSPALMALFFLEYGRHPFEVKFLFSHSERVSIDELQSDGSIVKKVIFKFQRFIELPC
ncbi:MAG: hypothetical protein N3A69_05035 [Leptospiraceae bacterium]|nr:hypothetical protein [Leptospiraceae bacterium]